MQITRVVRGPKVGPDQVLEAMEQERPEVRAQIVFFFGSAGFLHVVWANVRLTVRLSTQRKIADGTLLLEMAEGDPSQTYREKNRLKMVSPLGPLAIGTGGIPTLRNGVGVHGLACEAGEATTRPAHPTKEYARLRGAVEWLAKYSRCLLGSIHDLLRENMWHGRLLASLGVVEGSDEVERLDRPLEIMLHQEAGELENIILNLLGERQDGGGQPPLSAGESPDTSFPQTPTVDQVRRANRYGPSGIVPTGRQWKWQHTCRGECRNQKGEEGGA